MNCQVCVSTIKFNEPGDPMEMCFRETTYQGEKVHFCSDHCQEIFENEPEKYIEAWLPMQQLFQAPLFGDLPGWMDWVSLRAGKDNGDYEGSEDQQNFEAWRAKATSNQ